MDRMKIFENSPGNYTLVMDCPVLGYNREVKAIEYADGGRLEFPVTVGASSKSDIQSFQKALPKGAAGGDEDAA